MFRAASTLLYRPQSFGYSTMPVPFTKYKAEAELAVQAVLRGCYL